MDVEGRNRGLGRDCGRPMTVVPEAYCTVGISRVKQGVRALGMITIGIRIVIAGVVVAMLSSRHNRMFCGVQVSNQVQHRAHQRNQSQQRKEADSEQIEGGWDAEHYS